MKNNFDWLQVAIGKGRENLEPQVVFGDPRVQVRIFLLNYSGKKLREKYYKNQFKFQLKLFYTLKIIYYNIL